MKQSKMKHFKKRNIIISGILVICLLCVVAICIQVIAPYEKNKAFLNEMVEEFVNTIEDENIDVIETKSTYGKLNGNGNGIQFFGAALVDADISKVEAAAEKLRGIFELVEVKAQKTQIIESKYLEHQKLYFETDPENNGEFYCIVFFNSSHPDSDEFDILGH